jgi:outer membrane protein
MRLYFSLILIVIFTLSAYAQRTLTLDEAIKIALQKNTVLQKGMNNLESNHSNVKSAYGGLLPSLGAGGSWNWTRSIQKGGGGTSSFNGYILQNPAQTVDSRNYNVNAGANWTLFDGLANFASISQSNNQLESAELNLQRLKQNIVFQIIQNYYAVLNARQLLKVREDDLAWNQKNLDVITEKNKLGSVTLADVYAAQVKVGNSDLALIQAKNDYETTQSDLLNSLGIDVFQEIELVDPITNDTVAIQEGKTMINDYKDLKTAVDEALKNRFDYQGSLLDLESANNGITIARSGYYPQLGGSADFYMRANSISELTNSKTYSIGLSLNIPIFNGWSTEANVQMAKVNALNQEVTITELERAIKINLKKTYLDFQASQKALDVSQKNVQSAEQNRRIEQEKYNLGASALVNLLLASSDYTAALQTNINNRFQFFVLKSQLEYYLGILDYKKYEQ